MENYRSLLEKMNAELIVKKIDNIDYIADMFKDKAIKE